MHSPASVGPQALPSLPCLVKLARLQGCCIGDAEIRGSNHPQAIGRKGLVRVLFPEMVNFYPKTCISSVISCRLTLRKPFFYLHCNQIQGITFMDNYLITLGLYLILMLFFKVYFAVSAKD